MGMATKVMLHKKGSKQYTNLAVVQELYAHTGMESWSCIMSLRLTLTLLLP